MLACLIFIGYVACKPITKQTKLLNPIVRLTHDGRTFCTGTVIDEHTILTAAHCIVHEDLFGSVVDRSPIDIRTNENNPLGVYATPAWATMQMDQALLKGDFSAFEVRPYISDINKLITILKPGAKFTSCGYPLGGDLQCSSMVYVKPWIFMAAFKGVLLPGMSGGPTMLEDGTVVGTNDAGTEDYSIIVPTWNIDFAVDLVNKTTK